MERRRSSLLCRSLSVNDLDGGEAGGEGTALLHSSTASIMAAAAPLSLSPTAIPTANNENGTLLPPASIVLLEHSVTSDSDSQHGNHQHHHITPSHDHHDDHTEQQNALPSGHDHNHPAQAPPPTPLVTAAATAQSTRGSISKLRRHNEEQLRLSLLKLERYSSHQEDASVNRTQKLREFLRQSWMQEFVLEKEKSNNKRNNNNNNSTTTNHHHHHRYNSKNHNSLSTATTAAVDDFYVSFSTRDDETTPLQILSAGKKYSIHDFLNDPPPVRTGKGRQQQRQRRERRQRQKRRRQQQASAAGLNGISNNSSSNSHDDVHTANAAADIDDDDYDDDDDDDDEFDMDGDSNNSDVSFGQDMGDNDDDDDDDDSVDDGEELDVSGTLRMDRISRHSARREQLMESLTWFSFHAPRCVLEDLTNSKQQQENAIAEAEGIQGRRRHSNRQGGFDDADAVSLSSLSDDAFEADEKDEDVEEEDEEEDDVDADADDAPISLVNTVLSKPLMGGDTTTNSLQQQQHRGSLHGLPNRTHLHHHPLRNRPQSFHRDFPPRIRPLSYDHRYSSINSGASTTVSMLKLPFAVKRQSALVFVDISGFTKLSTMLDVESLSKVRTERERERERESKTWVSRVMYIYIEIHAAILCLLLWTTTCGRLGQPWLTILIRPCPIHTHTHTHTHALTHTHQTNRSLIPTFA